MPGIAKTSIFNVRLGRDLKRALQVESARQGLTPSDMVRAILSSALQQGDVVSGTREGVRIFHAAMLRGVARTVKRTRAILREEMAHEFDALEKGEWRPQRSAGPPLQRTDDNFNNGIDDDDDDAPAGELPAGAPPPRLPRPR